MSDRTTEHDLACEWLAGTWLLLRDGNSPTRRAYFAGAVDALHDIGVLTGEEQANWMECRDRCPGHDDESGRGWCGYCGTLRTEEAEYTA